MFQVSGQIREPLGQIYNAFNRIAPPERREQDPALDRDAALLFRGYYQLLRIVNNLADAAAFSSPFPLPLRNDDLFLLCRDLCREVEPVAQLCQQTLRFFYSGEENPVVAINRPGIQRLLLNLLSNAMKFTPAGGFITVSLSIGPENVELSVSDTGCGISQELLPTLFDRYLHPDRMDPMPHGLGLGLPICHHIATGHDGTLSAVSAEGFGTQITFTFPNRQAPNTTVRDIAFDYTGGFNPILVELADAAPADAFTHQYLD